MPSSGKKKENVPVSKQRKDSPAARKTPQTNYQKPAMKNTKVSVSQTNLKTKEAQRTQKPHFNYPSSQQTREQPKNRNEQYREYYSRNIEEITETNESQYERQREGTSPDQAEYNNVYFMNKMKNKNSGILNDIQSLDDEINKFPLKIVFLLNFNRLESETGLGNVQKPMNTQENQRVDERQYNSQPLRGRPEGEYIQNQRGGYGQKNWSDQKRSRSQQRENSTEKSEQGNERDNRPVI